MDFGSRFGRCLVDFDGETSTGTKVKHENLPAIILLKGSNFSPFEDEFKRSRKLEEYLYAALGPAL